MILRIKGRLDAITSPAAEKKVFDCVQKGHNKLILNFGGVDYLSSAGMRMLLSSTKRLKSISGKLAVCSVLPNVFDILKMSGFDHVIDIYTNEEEAIKKF